jgi:membrane-bound metal-dependent hydrolase YbcI (DUF457 family)
MVRAQAVDTLRVTLIRVDARAAVLHAHGTGAPAPLFHTHVGATLMAAFTVALCVTARRLCAAWWLPNPLPWRSLSPGAVIAGAAIGAWSHVLLDSVMHADITPFAPFSDANPQFRIVSLATLHWFCIACGAAALLAWGVRRMVAYPQRRDG